MSQQLTPPCGVKSVERLEHVSDPRKQPHTGQLLLLLTVKYGNEPSACICSYPCADHLRGDTEGKHGGAPGYLCASGKLVFQPFLRD